MPSPALRITVGRYEVVRGLDAPGRELYLAKRPKTPGEFVLAVFEVPRAHAKQLEQEVERSMKLDHPAIMRIVETFEHESKRVVVYDSAPGISLWRMVKQLDDQRERLSDGAILHIGHLLMDALSAAHTARDAGGKMSPIVHGELGPHQVFLSWDGEVKLLGFGLTPMFLLSAMAGSSPECARHCVAPEVRSGGMLTPRANAYSAAAVIWSLLTRREPPGDGEPHGKLRELRPDLSPQVATAIDRALDPSIRRRNTCQAVARALARAVRPEDIQDLRWSMEVLRAVSTIDEQALPGESFPPSIFPPAVTSVTPISSAPPDEDEPTTPFFEVPPELAHIKLPDSVIPPDSDAELPSPPPPPAEELPAVTPLRRKRATLQGMPETTGDVELASTSVDRSPPAKVRPLSAGKRRRSEERQKRPAPKPADKDDPLELEVDEEPAKRAPIGKIARPRKFQKTSLGLGKERDEALAQLAKSKPKPEPPSTLTSAPDEPSEGGSARKLPEPVVPPERLKPPPPRPDFDSALFDEITLDKGRFQRDREDDRPSDPPAEPGKPPVDPRTEAIPPPPPLRGAADGERSSVSQNASASEGPPSSQYPAYSQAPISVGPGSQATWMGNPVTIAPPGSVIVPAGSHMAAAGMLPMKWVIVVAVTAIASFALGLLVASGGVEVRIAASEPVTTAAPAPPPADPPASEAPVPKPPPAPPPEPKPAAEPAEEEPAAPEPEPGAKDESAITDDEASALPATQGYLIVKTPVDDGYVYVRGNQVGVVGKPLQVPCGLHFVRVGNQNRTRWYTRGRAIGVACQAVTRVTMAIGGGPDEPSGGQFLGSGKQNVWMPGDL